MHPSIKQVIDYSSELSLIGHEEFIELVCACFVYLHTFNQSNSPQTFQFNKKLTFNELNSSVKITLHLSTPLKVCLKNRPELENALNEFIAKIARLLQSKVINGKDLNTAIKVLYGKSSHHYVIPNELCQLGVDLLGSSIQQVYCPFEKGCDFALFFPEQTKVVTETNSKDDVFYAKVQIVLLNKSLQIIETDPIKSPSLIVDGGLRKFDAVIGMPPLGSRIKGKVDGDIWCRFPEDAFFGEVYYLRHMLAQSKGRVICFVSNAFLYRTAAGEYRFKQDIIENEILEGVIALPNGLLSHTSLDISLVVLDTRKTSLNVKFMDASSEAFTYKLSKTRNQLSNVKQLLDIYYNPYNYDDDLIVYSSMYEIADTDYNLSPARYLKSKDDRKLDEFLSGFKTTTLSELVDIIRPQALQHNEEGNEAANEYGLNNLNDIGLLAGSPRQLTLNSRQSKRAIKQLILPNDVLVVCRGAVGRVGFVPDKIGDNALANQAFAILRVKPLCRRMSPKALFQYLSSDYGKYQLSSLATGTTSLMLSSKDLSTMIVPALNKAQQEVMANAHQQAIDKQNAIEILQKELMGLRTQAIQEILI
ncbi:N-6 DNA methylase [Pseudocolwellia sp. AS88]|uniref:N-6 DNA methylase n=1 Tax=Pseudocolwellia sp. AS88 TaxID=3063958 RepID=UPI0026E9A7FE|nr:N-6 DNA methylase [Pseudocolwellia sp. AS88]MDO7084761.1 N-6 DNA methylase [Pseudocolwellia sp. AS88]